MHTCAAKDCSEEPGDLPSSLEFLDHPVCVYHVQYLLDILDQLEQMPVEKSYVEHVVCTEMRNLVYPSVGVPVLELLEGGKDETQQR
jgi:hypothetical protein